MSTYSRPPQRHELASCPRCGASIIAFHFPGGNVLEWDPDAHQRRCVQMICTIAERTRMRPWGDHFGGPHLCHSSDVASMRGTHQSCEFEEPRR